MLRTHFAIPQSNGENSTLLIDFTGTVHHLNAGRPPVTGNAQYLPAPVSQFGPGRG